jgi:hypothetical protein
LTETFPPKIKVTHLSSPFSSRSGQVCADLVFAAFRSADAVVRSLHHVSWTEVLPRMDLLMGRLSETLSPADCELKAALQSLFEEGNAHLKLKHKSGRTESRRLAPMMEHQVFVGNLPGGFRGEHLRILFENFTTACKNDSVNNSTLTGKSTADNPKNTNSMDSENNISNPETNKINITTSSNTAGGPKGAIRRLHLNKNLSDSGQACGFL